MNRIGDLFSDTPELALFASLALGYLVGKLRLGSIKLGGICGTLIVAIAIGQWGVTISDDLKNVAFALFIFALGFTGGPQFVANFNRRGLRVGVLSLVEVVAVLTLALGFTVMFDLDRGTAAGIMAGGATESAVVGTATEAIGKLDLSSAETATLQANVATGYTVAYLFGLITIVLFTSQFAPMMLGINLRDEAKKMWARLGGADTTPGVAPAVPALVGRVYAVDQAAGHTVAEVEHALDGEATIERVQRDHHDVDLTPDLRLGRGDQVVVMGRREAVVPAENVLGPEQPLSDGLALSVESADVVFTTKETEDATLGELRQRLGQDARHGAFLTKITRLEREVPALPNSEVHHGDVLTITGAPKDVDRLAKRIGFRIVPSNVTDLVLLGMGISAGILVGKVTLRIADIPLSLGTGGGSLVAGLVLGWARAKHPTFGSFPGPAAQVLKDFGLSTFIAAVGLGVGDQAWDLFDEYGLALPVMGILIVLVPALISLYIGSRVLHLEPPVHIGAIAGQQCSTPAITAVLEVAGNSTPLVGYTVTYAISNVLLPLLGPVIVGLAGSIN